MTNLTRSVQLMNSDGIVADGRRGTRVVSREDLVGRGDPILSNGWRAVGFP